MKKLIGLEAARGVAACSVVFYHAGNHIRQNFGVLPLGGVTQFGHSGVDFFFVLSGFIIYFIHRLDFGNPWQLGVYVERRLTRLFPIFWVAVTVSLIIVALSPTRVVPDIKEIMWDGFLLPIQGDAIVGVSWTLRHEMFFYTLFGLCVLHRILGWIVMCVWLVGILLNMAIGWDLSGSALLRIALSPFNVQFFMGMAAAWLVCLQWLSINRRWLFYGAGAFISFGVAENLGYLNGYGLSARWMYGLSAMIMVVGLATTNATFVSARAVLALGRASYSIYLFHLIGIGVAYKLWVLTGLVDFFPILVVYLSLCVAGVCLGLCMSRWVEYPLMRAVRSLLATR